MSVDFENIYKGAESDETGELLLEDIEAEISGIFEHIKSDYGVVRLNQALSDLKNYAEGDDELKSFLEENQDSVASEFIRLGAISETDWQTFKTEQTEKYHSSLPPAESWTSDLDPARTPEITREALAAKLQFPPDPFAEPELAAEFASVREAYLDEVAQKWHQKLELHQQAQQKLFETFSQQIAQTSPPNLDPISDSQIDFNQFSALFPKLDFSDLDAEKSQKLQNFWDEKVNTLWRDWQNLVQQAQKKQAEKEDAEIQQEQLRLAQLAREELEAKKKQEQEQREKELKEKKEMTEDKNDANEISDKQKSDWLEKIQNFDPDPKLAEKKFADFEAAFLAKNPELKNIYPDAKWAQKSLEKRWKNFLAELEKSQSSKEVKEVKDDDRNDREPILDDRRQMAEDGKQVLDEKLQMQEMKEVKEVKEMKEMKDDDRNDREEISNEQLQTAEKEDLKPPTNQLSNNPAFQNRTLKIKERDLPVAESRWKIMHADSRLHLNLVLHRYPGLSNFILETIAILPAEKFNSLLLRLREVKIQNASKSEVIDWMNVFCESVEIPFLKSRNPESFLAFQTYCQQYFSWSPSQQKREIEVLDLEETQISPPNETQNLEAEIQPAEDLDAENLVDEPMPEVADKEDENFEIEMEPAVAEVSDEEESQDLNAEIETELEIVEPETEQIEEIDDESPAEIEAENLDEIEMGDEETLPIEAEITDEVLLEEDAEFETEENAEILENDEVLEAWFANLEREVAENEAETDLEPDEFQHQYNSLRDRPTRLTISQKVSQIVRLLAAYSARGNGRAFEKLLGKLSGVLRQMVLQQMRLHGLLVPGARSPIELFRGAYFQSPSQVSLAQVFRAVERYLFWNYHKKITLPLFPEYEFLFLDAEVADQTFGKIVDEIEKNFCKFSGFWSH